MEKIDEIVIDNISRRMNDAGFSQKDLAKKAKVNYQALNRVLQKHSPASRGTIAGCARALGCSVTDLYTFHQEPTNHSLSALAETIATMAKENESLREQIAKLEAKNADLDGIIENLIAQVDSMRARTIPRDFPVSPEPQAPASKRKA